MAFRTEILSLIDSIQKRIDHLYNEAGVVMAGGIFLTLWILQALAVVLG